MIWRIITNNGYRQYPHEPTQEEYLRVGGIGEIQVIDEAPVWSKEAYSVEIESTVDEIVSAKLLELNYTNFKGEPSVGDVAAGVANTEAEWHLEAIEVNKWYSSVYSHMYNYLESVTEETALSPEDFIATLPTFTYG